MRPAQHATNNAVLGAPPGVSFDECGPLPITRVECTCGGGPPCIASFWRPSPDELALIAAGKPIRLICWGPVQAPIAMGVDGDGWTPGL